MNDQPTSGNRWEHADQPDAGRTATAVQDPVPEQTPGQTWAPPPVPERRGLKDRWRTTSAGARYGVLGAVALLLLLGTGLGGFAVGRATAPDGGSDPSGVDPGGRFGDRPDFDGDGPDGGFDGGQGGPPGLPDQGADQGTDPGADSGTTQSSWYVVPFAGSGPSAA